MVGKGEVGHIDFCFAYRYFIEDQFKCSYSFLTKFNKKTYLLQGTKADEYLEKLMELPHDYVISVDEDAFLFGKEELYELLKYIDENNIDVCGMRDGGAVPRGGHPLVINPFFLILNVKNLKARFNKNDINPDVDFDKYKPLVTDAVINKNNPHHYNLDVMEEPYYPFFFYLLDIKAKFYYLDSRKWQNDPGLVWEGEHVKIATMLKNNKGEDFLLHCWLSSYLDPTTRRPRFNTLYGHAKELERGLKFNSYNLYHRIHRKLFATLILKHPKKG